ncbi:NADH-quinone oxidoreductase subunit H [candidate division KSB1 bacterium]|nr:NADH-quinone oxidoreductase subunit H [candidate division KSB1 bacterium]RQW02069.1 MAG: NADH-quinone oxidoreductase subunit H [candidate division KSB1 bacterium]
MRPEYLFYLLVFPGLLFTGTLGLVVGCVDRKVSARFQFRVGPPFLQNFNDFFKLLGKETIITKEAVASLFISAPFIAFSMIVLVSAMIGTAMFFGVSFGGDVIVVMYLLMLYSVMVILGGACTGNVYSSIGAGREIKLLLADELAFILVLLVPIVKSGYVLSLDGILAAQQDGLFIGSASGIIAFIVGILCIQAKMTLTPFDIPEAETEIVDGPFMEYSGPPLAFWKLSHLMMWVTFPFLLILLFWGGFNLSGLGILWAILKYLLIVVVMIIIKNTNPRVRIDTALNFFWKYATPLALIALILAVLGA